MDDVHARMKERSRATWSSGDYSMIGVMFVPVSESLCESVELKAGQKVLDVATGTGNTALAAARRFCKVTGIDIVPAWIERARHRAEAEGLPADFHEGDAEALDFPDESFDVVMSTFGCMFAPDQQKTAFELLRVCRPGGKIALASWTPQGYAGQVLKTVSKYAPSPPPEFRPPVLWGTDERLRELFGEQGEMQQLNRKVFHFRFVSLSHAREMNNTYTGPIANVYDSLDEEKKAEFNRDMDALMTGANISGDESLLIPSEYLEAIIVKR